MTRFAIFVGMLSLLCSCGIQKIAEDTRDGVVTTNDGIKESNEKQAALLAEMKEMLVETKRLEELTARLVKGMDGTNAVIHLQTLTVAYQQMLSSTSNEWIDPPALLMAPAKAFADAATSHEIIEVVYAFLADVSHGFAEKKLESGALDLDSLRARSRRISFNAASAIAAFASDEKTNEILTREIEEGGDYADAAYAFAVCRYRFMHDYLFEQRIDRAKHFNPVFLKTMAARFASLKALVKKPYAAEMTFLAPKLLLVTEEGKTDALDVTFSFDPNDLKNDGKFAIAKFKGGLTTTQLATKAIQDLLEEFKL